MQYKSFKTETGWHGHTPKACFRDQSSFGWIKEYIFLVCTLDSQCRVWQRLAFPLTSLHLVCGSVPSGLLRVGDEWHGEVQYTFACWCDARAVFMRHHKYACCFVKCRGIYDSRVTVFALSEVIYLSSTVTVGMNKAEDNYASQLIGQFERV